MDIRLTALPAVSAVGAFAALMITAPSALAEPVTPTPPPPPDATTQPVVEAAAAPPTEIPHLTSPENLPPGTAIAPVGPPQGRNLTYLRELWHAMQTQEISGSEMLFLLAQRPLNPNAVPPPGLAPGPQPPLPAEPPPSVAPDPQLPPPPEPPPLAP
jgi:hypothetical protein